MSTPDMFAKIEQEMREKHRRDAVSFIVTPNDPGMAKFEAEMRIYGLTLNQIGKALCYAESHGWKP